MINDLVIVLAIVARPQSAYNQSNIECVNPNSSQHRETLYYVIEAYLKLDVRRKTYVTA